MPDPRLPEPSSLNCVLYFPRRAHIPRSVYKTTAGTKATDSLLPVRMEAGYVEHRPAEKIPSVKGCRNSDKPAGSFYGWWIVLAAFLNLFCSVGIIYYGFPVFYPSMIDALGF